MNIENDLCVTHGVQYASIKSWMNFLANYRHDWISKAWEGDDMMIKHFNEKFNYYLSLGPSLQAVSMFYYNLDEYNSKKLLSYVLKYY